MEELLSQGLLALELPTANVCKFLRYGELLVEKNKVMNLTAITEKEDVMVKHFADSIAVASCYDFVNQEVSLIDVGTGAGFPGIPLKIAFPSLDVTVVDSLAKRMKFLEVVIKELNLENIRCLAMRGEDFAKLHREEFDYVTARAVARLNILNEITIPLVKVGGYFVALKGQDGLIEIDECKDAFNKLGAKIEMIDEFNLPNENAKRINIFIKKEKKTNVIYPRDYAKIKKNPLK